MTERIWTVDYAEGRRDAIDGADLTDTQMEDALATLAWDFITAIAEDRMSVVDDAGRVARAVAGGAS